jgi:hypothetical protein
MAVRTRPTARKERGLSAKTFSGLSEKRMESKGGGGNPNAVRFPKEGGTIPVQFLQTPKEMKEFDQHQWKEDGRWYYVPCAGDDCPICDDEDSTKSKKNYRFVCNVYNLKERKVQVLEGSKTVASLIAYRYKRKPAVFLKRVYDITKFNTQPVTYNFELAEEATVRVSGLKLIDLDDYIDNALQAYLKNEGGAATKKSKRSALDDDEWEDEDELDDEDEEESDEEEEDEEDLDDDETDDEEEPDEDEMMDKETWPWSDLKDYAKENGIKKTYTKRSELVQAILKKRG